MRIRRVVLVALVVVIAGGCRAGDHAAHVVVGATTPTTQPTVRSVLDGLVLATVPSGYQVDALTASAGAVWFFAGSAQDGRVFHYDDTTGLRSFVIGVAPLDRAPAMPPTIAANDNDDAWLGMNDALLHVETHTGVVARIRVPSVPRDPVANSYGPPEVRGIDPITAIAGDGGGTMIAVLRRVAAVVEIYTPAHATFTSLAVPVGYQAIAVGFSADGDLVVGLYNRRAQRPNAVAYYRPGDRVGRLITVPDSQTITPGPPGRLLIGTQLPSLLSATGAVTPIPLRHEQLMLGVGIHQLGSAHLVAVDAEAVAFVDEHSGVVTRRVALPTFDCRSTPVPPPPPRSTVRLPSRCVSSPQALTAPSHRVVLLQPKDNTYGLYAISA